MTTIKEPTFTPDDLDNAELVANSIANSDNMDAAAVAKVLLKYIVEVRRLSQPFDIGATRVDMKMRSPDDIVRKTVQEILDMKPKHYAEGRDNFHRGERDQLSGFLAATYQWGSAIREKYSHLLGEDDD